MMSRLRLSSLESALFKPTLRLRAVSSRSSIWTGSASLSVRYALGVIVSPSSPAGGSMAMSCPDSRVSISNTSSGLTPSALAMPFASVRVSGPSFGFMLRRLKNSFRCALVVAILTSRQLRRMCS